MHKYNLKTYINVSKTFATNVTNSCVLISPLKQKQCLKQCCEGASPDVNRQGVPKPQGLPR